MAMRRPLIRRRRKRLKGLSFNRMIPNILTLLALCAGLTAIRFGFQGRWGMAVFATLLAGILDMLDGRLARMLKGTSRFGAELDSLSDFVSFGAAPAIVLYAWTLRDAGSLGWAVCMLFAVCCALRLARFNVSLEGEQMPPYAYNFFTGVPAPAGAGLVLLPMILWIGSGRAIFAEPAVVGATMLGVSLLLVSRIPTYAFKNFRVPNRFVVPTLIAVAMLAAFLVTAPWVTLGAVGFAYLFGIPLSMRAYRRLKEQAEGLHADAREETVAPGEPAAAHANPGNPHAEDDDKPKR